MLLSYSCDILQRLHQDLPDAILRQVRQCGHIPHVEKPMEAAKPYRSSLLATTIIPHKTTGLNASVAIIEKILSSSGSPAW
jgi:hypothetical protein